MKLPCAAERANRRLPTLSLIGLFLTLTAAPWVVALPARVGGFDDETQARPLQPGQPVLRELAGGVSHYYRVPVAAGQYLHVEVDQQGIDVALALYGPDGTKLVEQNNRRLALGREDLSFIVATGGEYRLEVKAQEATAPAGHYQVGLTELRTAKPADRDQVTAERAYAAGQRLRLQQPQALREALEQYTVALAAWRVLGDRYWEENTLANIGLVYFDLREYDKAQDSYKQALAIARDVGDQAGEGATLNKIGSLYTRLNRYEPALTSYDQALVIEREIGDRRGEADVLNGIGYVYVDLSEYDRALAYYEQALAIRREVGDRAGQSVTVRRIGNAYWRLSQHKKALTYFEEGLALAREVKDRDGEGAALGSIANIYNSLSQYDQALRYYEQALAIFRELKNRRFEGSALGNMGAAYRSLSQYEQALRYYEQALAIDRELKDRRSEGASLHNIGMAYSYLGQPEQALRYYEQALAIRREVKDRRGEALTLTNIGVALYELSQYDQALRHYQQALAIGREIKDRAEEGDALQDIGEVYYALGQYDQALRYYEEALTVHREVKDRKNEGGALQDLGALYNKRKQYDQAVGYYERALEIFRETKDRQGEAFVLSNLVGLWQARNNPRLAIMYGKMSVNAYQEIRGNIRGLERKLRESFDKAIGGVYRKLADLLISLGRLPEAQQVLGLLKQQEYFEFVRRDAQEAARLPGQAELTPEEAKLVEEYNKLAGGVTAVGTEIQALLAKRQRTAEEEQQLTRLEADRTIANRFFQKFLDRLAVELAETRRAGEKVYQLREAQGLMQDLRELGSGAVAIYTLVGEQKYRVLLITPNSQKAAEYTIAAADLNRKVLALREALQDPYTDPRPLAKELYQVLVGPIAKDLVDARAQTLMWSLDGVLRYLPMAALYDGQRYLVERYRNVLYTPASLPRLKDRPSAQWRGLGLGTSKGQGGFATLPGVVAELLAVIRDETGRLPAVPDELHGLIREDTARPGKAVMPGRVFLDEAFTEEAMKAELQRRYPLVHIASHFHFRPGNETNSFLLLGDGRRMTLAEIKSSTNLFGGVELLTLSACNTATSGAGADGKEVEGFGVLAQRQGAKAVLASLWPVADESTRLLMRRFYELRNSKGALSKAEALRASQLALLRGEGKPADPFAHPFYWAPFILIGNWK